MHEVRERVEKLADSFEQQAVIGDELGHLADVTAQQIRESGVVRMLQPREFGGYEAHPVDFFETVMEIAAHSGSAGWVCGVVGVHPWQLAQVDQRVQTEIWGRDPDTWVASPYAPFGRAREVEGGGYILDGRWPFSSGTDFCDWVILGGVIADRDGVVGAPPQMRHFILPRVDYEIDPDSWRVVGLKGTGSKDVIVRGAFVPAYRVIEPTDFDDGVAARASGRGNPLYSMPFGTMFSTAIAASTLGIAEGALAAFINYTRDRVNWRGAKVAQDPFQLASLGSSAADIQASRLHLLSDIARMYDTLAAGGMITVEQRVEARRNQVRASRRAVDAVDVLFAHAGGGCIRLDNPLQRFWRDLHAAMNHICNVAEPIYQAASLTAFGWPIPDTVKI